jgi:hypothetical protein
MHSSDPSLSVVSACPSYPPITIPYLAHIALIVQRSSSGRRDRRSPRPAPWDSGDSELVTKARAAVDAHELGGKSWARIRRKGIRSRCGAVHDSTTAPCLRRVYTFSFRRGEQPSEARRRTSFLLGSDQDVLRRQERPLKLVEDPSNFMDVVDDPLRPGGGGLDEELRCDDSVDLKCPLPSQRVGPQL